VLDVGVGLCVADFQKFPLGVVCAAALLNMAMHQTVQMHGVPSAIS